MRGFALRLARNGDEALHLIDQRFPQIVITDVEMPVPRRSGHGVPPCRRGPGARNIPIVLISGHPNLPRIADAIGTPYFLAKPFDLDLLTNVIDRQSARRSRLV